MRQNATLAELEPAQVKAVAALASGASMTTAAESAGVCRQTVHRWMRDDPEFVAALNAARTDAVAAIRGEFRGLATEAVATVRDILGSPNAPAAVRAKVALAILESVGGLTPERPGSCDPEEIRDDWIQIAKAKEMTKFGEW